MSIPLEATYTLGFLGAGQLAKMSALQAFRYGIQVITYSDRPENEPAQQMTPRNYSGTFDDIEAMTRFAEACDLVTLENEFIDSDILRKVENRSGTPILPSPGSFERIENKRIEKQTFENAGIPVTPWKVIGTEQDLAEFGQLHGWPYLLKSSKGGYDGYGNVTVENREQANSAFRQLGGYNNHEILAEAFVDFSHELAVQVARNQSGTVVYPCCETIQRNHICVAVKSPAPVSVSYRQEAQKLAVAAVEAIDGAGIYAFEFFLTKDGNLLLNESAPRPHNSGHYTIEGCTTSQFENHIRAVLGLPPGSAELKKPAAVMLNLLGSRHQPARLEAPDSIYLQQNAHLHLYGKLESKPGRKMGHLTLLGEDMDRIYTQAEELLQKIDI